MSPVQTSPRRQSSPFGALKSPALMRKQSLNVPAQSTLSVFVDQIPADNILAEVEITRKHYFDNGDLAFYDFDLKAIRLLPSEDVQKVRFGDVFPGVLRQKIDQLARSARATWGDARSRYLRLKAQATAPAPVAQAAIVCPKCGRSFRNTEVLTVRDGKIVEAEVYFGWNVPHTAPSGGFVEDTSQV